MSDALMILNIIGSPRKDDISLFCARRNFSRDTFGKAYHAGDAEAISQLSIEMIKDIEEQENTPKEFHKRTLMQCIYWKNRSKKDIQFPSEFYIWISAVLFPKSQFKSLQTEAKRLFITSFSSLHQALTGEEQNISLVAKALNFVMNKELDIDRKNVSSVLKNEHQLVLEGIQKTAIAEANLQQSLDLFSKEKKLVSHSDLLEENIRKGRSGCAGNDGIFWEIYKQVKDPLK